MKWNELEILFNVAIPMANTQKTYKELLSNVLKDTYNNLRDEMPEEEFNQFEIDVKVNCGVEFWDNFKNGDSEALFTAAGNSPTEARNIASNYIRSIKDNLNEKYHDTLDDHLDKYVEDANKLNESKPFITSKEEFALKYEESCKKYEEEQVSIKELAKTNPKEAADIYFKNGTTQVVNAYYRDLIINKCKEQNIDFTMDGKYNTGLNADVIKFLRDPDCTLEISSNLFEKEQENAINAKKQSPIQEEVDEAKAKYPEYAKVLDEINETHMANTAKFAQYTEGATNILEKASDLHSSKDPTNEFLDKNEKYKYLFKQTDQNIEFIPETNTKDATELFNECHFDLSPQTKQGLNTLLDKMNELNIIGKSSSSKGEEEGKVYAYHNLLEKTMEVRDLIKEGKIEEAQVKNNEYKELKGKYHELMDTCEETLGNKGLNMPGNLSTTRNGAVPEDINERMEANSQLNGLYLFVNYTSLKGYDPKEFINKPEEHMKKMLVGYNESFENKYNDKNVSQGYKLAHMIYEEDCPVTYLEPRAIEFIVKAEKDEEQVKKNAVFQAMVNGEDMKINEIGYSSMRFFANNKGNDINFESLRNYIAAGDQYSITEFVPNMLNGRTMRNYDSTFDYQKFLKEDKRPTKEIVHNLKEQLFEALVESNPLDADELISRTEYKDYSSLVIGTQSYLSDLVEERGLDLNDPENAEIREMFQSPFGVLNKMCEERNVQVDSLLNHNYVALKIRYGIKEFAAETQTKGAMDLYYKHVENQSTSDLQLEYNKRFSGQSLDTKELTKLAVLGFRLQDRYDRRTIFGKAFRPDAYRERNVLSKIKQDLRSNGLTDEQINLAFSAPDQEDAIKYIDEAITSKLSAKYHEDHPEEVAPNSFVMYKGLEANFVNPKANEFFTDLVSYANRINEIDQDNYHDDPTLLEEHHAKVYCINEAMTNFLNTTLKQIPEENLDAAVEEMIAPEQKEDYHNQLNQFSAHAITHSIEDTDPLHKEAYDMLFGKDQEGNIPEKIQIIKAKMKPEQLKKFNESISENRTFAIKSAYHNFKSREDINQFAKAISKKYRPEYNAGLCNVKELKAPQNNIEAFEKPMQEENINELKKLNNPILNPILDDCNKILTKPDQQLTHYMSNVAEDVGVLNDKHNSSKVYQAVEKDPASSGLLDMGRTHMNIKKNNASVESSLSKKFYNEMPKFDDETKAQLKDVVKEMIDSKIFDENTYSAEQGFKVYSFAKITNAKHQLNKAVTEKDPEKIKEAYDNYKDYEQKYDHILEKIHKINPSKNIISNISSAREDSVPSKYRNNYIDGSKLTGIWMYLGMCKTSKVDPYEAIDDPAKAFKKIYDKPLNHTNVSKYLKEHSLTDCIKALDAPFTGELQKAGMKDDAINSAFERGTKGLLYLTDYDKNFEMYKNVDGFTAVYVNNIIESHAQYNGFGYDKENIKNFICVEPQDRDCFKIAKDAQKYLDTKTMEAHAKFDRNEYIKSDKTSMFRVTKRLYDLSTDLKADAALNKKYTPIIKEYATELLNNKELEKTPEITNILTGLSKDDRISIDKDAVEIVSSMAENETEYEKKTYLDIPQDPEPIEFVEEKENEEDLEIEVNGKKMDLEKDLEKEIDLN